MKTKYFKGVAFAALAVAPALLCAHSAAAAQPGAPPAAQPSGSAMLGEIIVTARKRQESILNVPVIETALPQAQLQRFQTQDLKDIATLVPGIALGDSILSIGTQISIRGVGTSTFNPGIDQSVTLNVDGLQLSQGLAFSSAMFDMSQVEVLKGPQSLFYGKTSTGGVISIRTADPTDKFEVIGRAGYEFEAREHQGEIIVSGPITDTLKARIAARYDTSEGDFENLATGLPALGSRDPSFKNQPDKGYMIRGTVLWNPTSQFDARLKINQVRDKQNEAGVEQYVSCPEGTGPATPAGEPGVAIPFLNPNDECKLNHQFYMVDYNLASFPNLPNGGTPYVETTQTYGDLELNWRPRPDLTVTSTTGMYLLHSTSLFNTTMTGLSAPILGVTNGFHRREVTEELRVNSDFAGPFNFTAGGFLQRGDFDDLVTLHGNRALGLPLVVEKGTNIVDIRTNSLFGQLRYKIIPQVEIAAGARWTDEKRKDAPLLFVGSTVIPVTLLNPEIKSSNVSPEITVTYKPTDDVTVFGAVKRGFKSGSFDTATPALPFTDNSFGDEKVEGGELGLKTRMLERRMLFNIAAYKYRYSGLQVGAISPTQNNIPAIRTINAGSALVYGIEGDVAYRPEWVENLNLRASANWNHGQLKSLKGVPCFGGQTIAQGCNEGFSPAANSGLTPPGAFIAQDRSGLPLIRAPKWQANFGFDYDVDIGNDMKLIVASSTQYSSRYLTNFPIPYYQESFFKTDVSLTLQGPKDRWEFALIGKNLNDAITTGNCSNSNSQGGLLPGTQITGTASGRGPNGIDEIGCWADRGREVWLRLTLKPFS